MVQRTIVGPFSASKLGPGVWRLATGVSPVAEVIVRGVGPEGSEALRDGSIGSLRFEWHEKTVKLAIIGANGSRYLNIVGAILHEPQPDLYRCLPLARFDAAARQFWRRVFFWIRVPGGRFLLRLIARGSRSKSRDVSV